jgi:hypothetical protein
MEWRSVASRKSTRTADRFAAAFRRMLRPSRNGDDEFPPPQRCAMLDLSLTDSTAKPLGNRTWNGVNVAADIPLSGSR